MPKIIPLTIVLTLYFFATVYSNDLRIGYKNGLSRMVFYAMKEANPALWKRTDEIVINTTGNEVISAIYITDLRPEKDGEAYIANGGIGSNTVTIGLKSPTIFRGYTFEIEVYANNPNAGYQSKGGSGYINYQDAQYARKF